MRNRSSLPVGSPQLNDPRGPVRTGMEQCSSRATARIGLAEVALDAVTVSSGRVVVATPAEWQWQHDETDVAGEVLVVVPGLPHVEVRLTGWWGLLAPGMLWLDPVEGLIKSGDDRLHLEDRSAVYRFLR